MLNEHFKRFFVLSFLSVFGLNSLCSAADSASTISKQISNKMIYQTERLELHRMSSQDVEFLTNHFAQHEVSEPSGLGSLNIDMARDIASNMLHYSLQINSVIIFLKDKHEPIGFLQLPYLLHFREALADIAQEYRASIVQKNPVDVGCSIEPNHWKKGYGEEFLKGLITYFQGDHQEVIPNIKIDALTANISPKNEPCIGLFLKCGFYLYGPKLSPEGRQLYVYDLKLTSKH